MLDVERTPAFHDLLNDLIREHNAQTETQLNLIETMTMARWRIARLWAIEREILQTEMGKPEHESDDVAANLTKAFRALAERDGILGLLNRYEARLDRQYSRALNLLIKLADPNSPLTQFRQTNPSGIGLPACPAAEGGSPQPSTDPARNAEPPQSAPPPPESSQQTPRPAPKSPVTPISPSPDTRQSQKSSPAAENPPSDSPQTGGKPRMI